MPDVWELSLGGCSRILLRVIMANINPPATTIMNNTRFNLLNISAMDLNIWVVGLFFIIYHLVYTPMVIGLDVTESLEVEDGVKLIPIICFLGRLFSIALKNCNRFFRGIGSPRVIVINFGVNPLIPISVFVPFASDCVKL